MARPRLFSRVSLYSSTSEDELGKLLFAIATPRVSLTVLSAIFSLIPLHV